MKNIFVAGSYFSTNDKDINVYKEIAKYLRKRYPKKQIFEPDDIQNYREKYILDNPKATIADINAAMVNYDLQQVANSELMIADLTNKSTGLGIELGTIKKLNNRIVFIAKKNSKVSNMVFGYFPNTETYYYDTDNLLSIIDTICEKYIDSLNK